jgi:hypothetical protein
MSSKYIELFIAHEYGKERLWLFDFTIIRKSSSHQTRWIRHIHGFKIGIDLTIAYNGFISLVKMLCLAISLTAKHRILEGDVAIYDVFIVVEIVIKDIWG